MAMKPFTSLLLFAVCTEVFSKHCSKQADCEEGECCLKRWPMSSSRCERRRAENQSCVRLISTTFFGDVHLFHCPCRKGLRCKFHQSTGKLGTLFFSPKCIEPVKTIPEEPDITLDDGSEPEFPVIENGIPPIDGGIVESELDERAGVGITGGTEPGLEKEGEVQETGTEVEGKVDGEGEKPDLDKEDEEKDADSDAEDKDEDEVKDVESGVEKEDNGRSESTEPDLEEKVKDTTSDSEEKVDNEGTAPPSEEKVDVEVVTEFLMGMPRLDDESSEREVNEDELPAIIPDLGE